LFLVSRGQHQILPLSVVPWKNLFRYLWKKTLLPNLEKNLPMPMLGALKSISKVPWSKHDLAIKTVFATHALLCSGITVQYVWIMAHQEIPGNYTITRFLAKLSAMAFLIQPQVVCKKSFYQPFFTSSLVLGYPIIACNCGKSSMLTTVKAITCKLFYPGMDTDQAKWFVHVETFRLRAGHCKRHFHLNRIRLYSNGLCNECNTPETVEHFLIQCDKYAKARHKSRESIQYINGNIDRLTLLKDAKAKLYVLAFIHQAGR